MARQKWKAGNMIYPLPAVMVSCGTVEQANIVTVAWTGTVCTNPAMTYISLRKTRYSYDLIKDSGYFTINLTTQKLAKITDFCGVRSGRNHNKFQEMGLTATIDEETGCPMIEESPVSVVCKVTEIKELGSHDLFLAEVVNVYIDEKYMDEKGKFHLNKSELIAYSHGTYFSLGEELGTFGYSVMKPKKLKEKQKEKEVTQIHKKYKAKENHLTKSNDSSKKNNSTSSKKKKNKNTKKK